VSQNATGEGGSAFGRIVVGVLGPLVFPVIAIVLSFIIGAVIVLATGNNPIAAYASLVEGAVGDPLALGRTLLYTTPLIFTGLAVAVAFRAGLFNIGGEGQIFMGAIAAAWLGVSLGSLGAIAIPLVLAGSLVAGFSVGRHTRRAQGLLRGARGDHHHHAELRGHLPRVLPGE
jgi:general nucleoside transport system permease protein